MQTLYRHRHRGFTLIEMAVVLVIVGLLLGGMLVPLATQMETDRRKETTATLESIREALDRLCRDQWSPALPRYQRRRYRRGGLQHRRESTQCRRPAVCDAGRQCPRCLE